MLIIETAWLTGGRPGEAGYISFDNMVWNVFFKCVACEIYQWKVDKEKFVPFVCGRIRYLCW